MGKAEELNNTNPYADPSELKWIRNHAGMYSPLTCVMLGAGPGVLAVALKEGSPLTDLWVVDIGTTAFVEAHLVGYGLYQNFHSIIGDSAEAGKKWDGPAVDFLIVDAAHDEESVKKDIDAWWPHVALGGFVFFHDYLEREGGFNGTGEWKPGGVSKAIRKSVNTHWEVICPVGISVVYRKVK